MPLTDSKIRATKPTDKVFRLADRDGLALEIRPTGAKFWRFRYRLHGKEQMFAGGEYVQPPAFESPDDARLRVEAGKLTLAEARIELTKWRAAVKNGSHPADLREERLRKRGEDRASTFGSAFDQWVEANPLWSATYRSQIQRTFATHVLPRLRDRPIKEITPLEMKSVIQAMKRQRKAANPLNKDQLFKALQAQTKKWCSAVFQLAIENQLRDDDPTSGLNSIRRAESTNHVLLTEDQFGQLLTALKQFRGSPVSLAAMQLLMLTFVRTGELRQAKWAEFDLELCEWTVPKERMKRNLELWVPLSSQAMQVLNRLHAITGRGEYLFPNARDPKRPMSATTINRCLERLGFNGKGTVGFSAHGFRTFASTQLNECAQKEGFSPDAIERQLAHVVRKNVRGTYNKAMYKPERTRMMQYWADYIDSIADKHQ